MKSLTLSGKQAALKKHFIILLLQLLIGKDCFSMHAANHFQGKWVNDYGSVTIKECKDKLCKIEIGTAIGANTCEIDSTLVIKDRIQAVFYLQNINSPKSNLLPINLSLSKQIIRVTIPDGSKQVASQSCGLNGYFDGKYTNINIPRTYEASFNCELAKTKIEIAICQSAFLAHADSVLSSLYFKLKEKHPNTIVSEQREWMNDRNLCANSNYLISCLSDKYLDRILVLEQAYISDHSQVDQKNKTSPYNYEYLLYLSKHSNESERDIYNDPPLQSYLKTILPKTVKKDILTRSFYRLFEVLTADSLIMITGGTPGLYTICEGALALTKDNQTWLAYIDVDAQGKTKIVLLYPQGISTTLVPAPLKKWVNDRLDAIQNKNIEYIAHS